MAPDPFEKKPDGNSFPFGYNLVVISGCDNPGTCYIKSALGRSLFSGRSRLLRASSPLTYHMGLSNAVTHLELFSRKLRFLSTKITKIKKIKDEAVKNGLGSNVD